MNQTPLKKAFLKTLPVMAGYLFLGFAFGLLLKTSGYPLWVPVLMSLLIYSGALEFAAAPLLPLPLEPAGSFFLGLFISVRHLFYGIPMLKKYRKAGKFLPFLIFGLTDETFSLLVSEEDPEEVDSNTAGVMAGSEAAGNTAGSETSSDTAGDISVSDITAGTSGSVSSVLPYYVLVTLLDYSYWVLGTLFGAAAGHLIPLDLTGLDFSLTALFLVLFLEQMKNKTAVKSGLTGFLVSGAVLFLFGQSRMVLFSMVFLLILLCMGRRAGIYD